MSKQLKEPEIYSALLALETRRAHGWDKHGEAYMHKQV